MNSKSQKNLFIWIIVVIIILVLLYAFGVFGTKTENNNPSDTTATESMNTTQTLSSYILGTWQSVDDAKYEVSYNSPDKFSESYDGAEQSSGTWKLLTTLENVAPQYGDFVKSGNFLEVQRSDGPYYYKITKSEGGSLQMIYLDHGNMLNFKKVN